MRFERWLYSIPLRLRSLFRRDAVEHELDDELQFHLDQKTQHYIGGGLAPEDARRKALRDIDGLELRKDECRDARRVSRLEDLIQDLRFSLQHAAQGARLHRGRGAYARARYRRQCRDFQRRECRSPSILALSQFR